MKRNVASIVLLSFVVSYHASANSNELAVEDSFEAELCTNMDLLTGEQSTFAAVAITQTENSHEVTTAAVSAMTSMNDDTITSELTSVISREEQGGDADTFGEMASIEDSELSETRGTGLGGLLLSSDVSANLTNNTNNGGVTGSNQIGDGAFNNASGIIVGIQNSGNNVIIQNSMNLSVNFNQ